MTKPPFPSSVAERFSVRFPDGMRDAVAAAAKAAGRTMNAEIVFQLAQAYSINPEAKEHIVARSDPQFSMRLPAELLGAIEAAASASVRSMTAETKHRLSEVFSGSAETLRDRLAMAALPVVAPGYHEKDEDFLRIGAWDDCADGAYAMADAMLRARGRK